MQEQQISLYYRDGGSDKVYHTQLQAKDGGFVVNFQYGRRGSTLQTGTKTASPVDYAKAEKIFTKLVNEKKGKGYTEGENGVPFQGSDKAGEQSGLIPQLLNAIDEATLKTVGADDNWLMQEKIDGIRCMTRVVADNAVEASNRKGMFIAIPTIVSEAILRLVGGGQSVFDGEMVGETYHIFDLLEIDNEDLRQCGVEERYDRLRALFADDDDDPNVKLVTAYKTHSGKQRAFKQLKADRAEGVVFKQKNASYVAGRPNSGGNALKYKFKSSATCMVLAKNEGKRSVQLGLMTGDCELSSEHRNVGNVTIPSNFEIPEPGTLVEVEYLYAFPQGSLFQPVYKGPRTDKERADWDGSQKFKQGTTDEDEN